MTTYVIKNVNIIFDSDISDPKKALDDFQQNLNQGLDAAFFVKENSELEIEEENKPFVYVKLVEEIEENMEEI